VTNIDNNFYALLIAGAIGLVVAVVIAMMVKGSIRAPLEFERGTSRSLAVTALVMLFGWWLIQNWSDFITRARGFAAVFMFVFLGGAIIIKAIDHRREPNKVWFRAYRAIASLMILGGIFIPITRTFDEHTVFALEAYEIVLFAAYWIVQTAEKLGRAGHRHRAGGPGRSHGLVWVTRGTVWRYPMPKGADDRTCRKARSGQTKPGVG
jgi:hypothetical protein